MHAARSHCDEAAHPAGGDLVLIQHFAGEAVVQGEFHGFLCKGSRHKLVAREVREIPGIVRALRNRLGGCDRVCEKRCIPSRFGEQHRLAQLRARRGVLAVRRDAIRTEEQPFGQRPGG
ncbi:hypothetical protein D3C85_1213080 [compost metagenome]